MVRRTQFVRNRHVLGKKANIRSLKRYCMEIWSEYVRERDNHKCIMCGRDSYVQAHHIITRKYTPTRYDINCGVSLCAGCHTLRITSAHCSPWVLYNWLEKNRPEQYKWFLKARENIDKPHDLKLNKEYYQKQLSYLIQEFEKVAPTKFTKCKYSQFSSKTELEICNDYSIKILSRRDLAKKYETDEGTIGSILKRHNVKMRRCGQLTRDMKELKVELAMENANDEPSGKV